MPYPYYDIFQNCLLRLKQSCFRAHKVALQYKGPTKMFNLLNLCFAKWLSTTTYPSIGILPFCAYNKQHLKRFNLILSLVVWDVFSSVWERQCVHSVVMRFSHYIYIYYISSDSLYVICENAFSPQTASRSVPSNYSFTVTSVSSVVNSNALQN
jgi:hypothetical protein